MSAKAYSEIFGADALTSFLRSVAGVSRVEDVEIADRFRINRELRDAANRDSSALGVSVRRAFAKMWVRK